MVKLGEAPYEQGRQIHTHLVRTNCCYERGPVWPTCYRSADCFPQGMSHWGSSLSLRCRCVTLTEELTQPDQTYWGEVDVAGSTQHGHIVLELVEQTLLYLKTRGEVTLILSVILSTWLRASSTVDVLLWAFLWDSNIITFCLLERSIHAPLPHTFFHFFSNAAILSNSISV